MVAMPAPVAASDAIPLNPLRALVSPYTWLASVHLTLNLFTAMVAFPIVLVPLLLAGPFMLLGLLGIPIFLLAAYLALGIGALDRARAKFFLGVETATPLRPLRSQSRTFFSYVGSVVRSSTVWRHIAYALVQLPFAILSFVGVSLAWSMPAVLVSAAFWYNSVPAGRADFWLFEVQGPASASIAIALGVAWLVVLTPAIIRGLALMNGALVRALLGRRASEQLTERVGELEVTRRRVVDAAEAERRRIERDLHDGAQQRLTSLAMSLGRARVRLDEQSDPAMRALIEDAHHEAKEAIVELRQLTRGLHPPVLTDRGLDAALSALAARSPVPVDVTVDLPVRPSPTVEAIAYFVTAEALTNIAKHAGATRTTVTVHAVNDRLHICVEDNGKGGAVAVAGGGLAGLRDRVAAVDGALSVSSPAGGPTVVRVELPCR